MMGYRAILFVNDGHYCRSSAQQQKILSFSRDKSAFNSCLTSSRPPHEAADSNMKPRSNISKRDSFAAMEDLAWASDSFGSLMSESEASYVQPEIKKLCGSDESWFSEAESDVSDFECSRSGDTTKQITMGMGSKHQKIARGRGSKPRGALATEVEAIGTARRHTSHTVDSMFPDVDEFLSELKSEAEATVSNVSKGRKNRKGSNDSGFWENDSKVSRFGQNIDFVEHDFVDEPETKSDQYYSHKKNKENEERRSKYGGARSEANAENALVLDSESVAGRLRKADRKKRRETAVGSEVSDSERESSVAASKSKQLMTSTERERKKLASDIGSETDSSLSPKVKERGGASDGQVDRARRRSTTCNSLLRRESSRKSFRRLDLQEESGNELKSRPGGRISSGQSEVSVEGLCKSRKPSGENKIDAFDERSHKSRQTLTVVARGESKRTLASSDIDTDSERNGRGRRTSGAASTDVEGDRQRSKSMSHRKDYKEQNSLLGQDETEVTDDECESELDLSLRREVSKSQNIDDFERDQNLLPRKGVRKARSIELEIERDLSSQKGLRKSKSLDMDTSDCIRRTKNEMINIPSDDEKDDRRQARRSTVQHSDHSVKGNLRQERRSTIQHAQESEKDVLRQERRSTMQHAQKPEKGVPRQERRPTIQHAQESDKGVARQVRRSTIQHTQESEEGGPTQHRRFTIQHAQESE
jgi:hypothetical protein